MSDSHVALPVAGRGRAVLVLHEAWGLTPDIEWAASKIASLGYVAVAPDLTSAMGGTVAALRQIIKGEGPLIESAVNAVDSVLRLPQVDEAPPGVVGFSMGAALALLVAGRRPLGMVGMNYGMVPPGMTRGLRTPVVASFGSADRLLLRQDRPLRRRLARSGHDIKVYQRAGHSFMTPQDHHRPITRALFGLAFAPAAAEDAWKRLAVFMGHHLAPTTSGSRS